MSVEKQQILFVCRYDLEGCHFRKIKWPRSLAPTRRDRKTNKRMYSYLLFGANNSKVSKITTSNCMTRNPDWMFITHTQKVLDKVFVF